MDAVVRCMGIGSVTNKSGGRRGIVPWACKGRTTGRELEWGCQRYWLQANPRRWSWKKLQEMEASSKGVRNQLDTAAGEDVSAGFCVTQDGANAARSAVQPIEEIVRGTKKTRHLFVPFGRTERNIGGALLTLVQNSLVMHPRLPRGLTRIDVLLVGRVGRASRGEWLGDSSCA